jgi:molybdate transport system substrate-binding protein
MKKMMRSILAALLLFCTQAHGAQSVTIAVAANMKDAFAEINTAFRETSKADVRVVFGSSGNFSAQIMNGAPYSLFIAADEYFPLELYKNGKTVNEGSVYAIGKLALITKKGFSGPNIKTKTDIAGAIAKANKVAIAKPELSPYGKATVEYLKSEGLWNLAKDKLIYGDNISVATMYVVTGGADLGFSALSLAASPELIKNTSYVLVDDRQYQAIKQRMVLIKGAPPEAVDLYRFMQSPKAKTILGQYGYLTP